MKFIVIHAICAAIFIFGWAIRRHFLRINCPWTILIIVEAPVRSVKSSRRSCLQDAFALYRFVLFKWSITHRICFTTKHDINFQARRRYLVLDSRLWTWSILYRSRGWQVACRFAKSQVSFTILSSSTISDILMWGFDRKILIYVSFRANPDRGFENSKRSGHI